MTTTDTNPRQDLADLEARILAGDDTVTAAALQKARAAAELADLQEIAERRRAEQATADARHTAETAYRTAVADRLAHLPTVQAAYAAAVDALRTLDHEVAEWQQQRLDLRQRGKSLGLADEVDAQLPDLSRRDWATVANDEAHGRLDRHHVANRRHGSVISAPVRFHVLHDPRTRQQIEADDAARAAAKAERIQQREAERVGRTPSAKLESVEP